MRPLRFCMLTTFYPPYNFGGDGVAIQQLARALVKRGHEVTVIHDVDTYNATSDGPEPDPGPPANDGVAVLSLRSGLGALAPLVTHQTGRALLSGRTIRRHLEEGRFDVINLHNASMVGGPGIVASSRALKLYMAHEYWLVCPTHDLWRHRREPCTGRECVRCTLRYRRPPQLWRYTGMLERQLRHIDAFIAPSEFCRDKHYEFGFPRKMEVVPNFLPDPNGQEPGAAEGAPGEADPSKAEAAEAAPHERPYFVFVGRLKRIKGLDDVIPVFRDYEDADLLIAGDGDHGPVLRELAAGNDRVRFLGHVPPERLGPYLRHSIAALMPTISFETFGMSMIEAFRQSTPVIARRAGAPIEILDRCGGGEFFSDAEELRAAMHRLQSDPALRARRSLAAYEGYLQQWSETAVLPRYLDVVRRSAEARGLSEVAAATGHHPAY